MTPAKDILLIECSIVNYCGVRFPGVLQDFTTSVKSEDYMLFLFLKKVKQK